MLMDLSFLIYSHRRSLRPITTYKPGKLAASENAPLGFNYRHHRNLSTISHVVLAIVAVYHCKHIGF